MAHMINKRQALDELKHRREQLEYFEGQVKAMNSRHVICPACMVVKEAAKHNLRADICWCDYESPAIESD